MNISISSILLGFGGKCLLDWVLTLSQKPLCRSFVAVFGVSLALVDTALTLTLTALYALSDVRLFGLRLTSHHVCLLVQIVGQTCGALQWPVAALSCWDRYVTMSGGSNVTTTRPGTTALTLATVLLWCGSLLYVFSLSEFQPVLGDEFPFQLQKCWVFHSSQTLYVATVTILTGTCAAVYLRLTPRRRGSQTPGETRNGTPSRRDIVRQVLMTFLRTWAPLLVLLVLLAVFRVEIPAHLSLNVPWLCFLNSALTAAILCASHPASRRDRGLAAFPLDSFCDWRLAQQQGK